MLKDDLLTVGKTVTADEFQHLQNEMADVYIMTAALERCRTAKSVLKYLYVELEGRARQSYVSRIYGRYRKLLPNDDSTTLSSWPRRQYNGKS